MGKTGKNIIAAGLWLLTVRCMLRLSDKSAGESRQSTHDQLQTTSIAMAGPSMPFTLFMHLI
jgi:hypothetical protein